MSRRIFLAAISAAFALGIACAAQTPGKVVIPVGKAAPYDGKQMFQSYCAPCHGADGRGAGPAAPALKAQPIDLTLLSRNNHGKFPDSHIIAILQFGVVTPAHGSAQMPVWGPIFGHIDRGTDAEKQLRISNLTRYLETIQVR